MGVGKYGKGRHIENEQLLKFSFSNQLPLAKFSVCLVSESHKLSILTENMLRSFKFVKVYSDFSISNTRRTGKFVGGQRFVFNALLEVCLLKIYRGFVDDQAVVHL